MDVKLKSCTVGHWRTRCYLIEYNSIGYLVDPGDDPERIEKELGLHDIDIKGILNTHGHFDHMGAAHYFRTKYGIPFFINMFDKHQLRQSNIYRKLAGVPGFTKIPQIDGYLEDTQFFELCGKKINVHHTPGHTQGSVSFEIDRMLFSGDLLFHDRIGRYDLPGGNKEELTKSLESIFIKFVGYCIHPGHSESFILTEEKVDELRNTLGWE